MKEERDIMEAKMERLQAKMDQQRAEAEAQRRALEAEMASKMERQILQMAQHIATTIDPDKKPPYLG
jgi:uncharacterized membrane-anchored protein YhcB (DUF1043 family)